jgi:glycosyltransferase involved in cell wall biosynthesis
MITRMTARPLRIFIHDYSGHPPQVHVSRELARRGHTVLHAYAGMFQTPHGALTCRGNDPESLAIIGLDIGEKFAKYSYFKRQLQEMKYGWKLVEVAAAFEPDLVVCSDTPLFPLNSLRHYAWRRGVPFVFWMMDFYGMGIKAGLADKIPFAGALIGNLCIAFEKFLVRHSDHTVVISEDFRDLLLRWKVLPERIDTLPLWAPLDDIPLRAKDNRWAQSQGLTETMNIIYAGTLGLKHNPQHLVTLAERFRDREDVCIVVLSEGLGADFLKKERAKRGLTNLRLLPFQPFADMPDIFGAADILLVLLNSEAGVYAVPGKVLSHLCTGRPQVGLMPLNNRAARVINESGGGIAVDPSRPDEFVAAVLRLVNDPEQRAAMGRKARAYAEREFDIVRIGTTFEHMITTPLRKSRGTSVAGT